MVFAPQRRNVRTNRMPTTLARNANDTGFLNDPRFQELPPKMVVYTSVVAFLAWLFAVYDFTIFGTILPLISKDFGWSAEQAGEAATWISVGVLIVSLCVGPIIDHFGRKKALIISCAGTVLSSLLAGFATGMLFLVIVRALSGFGYSEQAVNSTYLNELYGAKRRGFWYGLIQGGWPLGVMGGAAVTALLAGLTWRELFWVATIPIAIIGFVSFSLKESPKYNVLTAIKQFNRAGDHERANQLAEKFNISTRGANEATYRQIFNRDLRKQTITLFIAYILNWCAVAVFVILGTTILTKGLHLQFKSSLMIFIVSNIVAWAGFIVMGYIGDTIGRKFTVGASWIISGIAWTVMLFLPLSFTGVIVLYSIGLFFNQGPFSALFTYMGESFPARARGTGMSLINAGGPIGGIIGTALFTAIVGAGLSTPVSAILAGALPMFIAGIIILMFGRRIRPGQELESADDIVRVTG